MTKASKYTRKNIEKINGIIEYQKLVSKVSQNNDKFYYEIKASSEKELLSIINDSNKQDNITQYLMNLLKNTKAFNNFYKKIVEPYADKNNFDVIYNKALYIKPYKELNKNTSQYGAIFTLSFVSISIKGAEYKGSFNKLPLLEKNISKYYYTESTAIPVCESDCVSYSLTQEAYDYMNNSNKYGHYFINLYHKLGSKDNLYTVKASQDGKINLNTTEDFEAYRKELNDFQSLVNAIKQTIYLDGNLKGNI